jgi:hypothetical protein
VDEETATADIESIVRDLLEINYVTLMTDLEIRCVASSMPNPVNIPAN